MICDEPANVVAVTLPSSSTLRNMTRAGVYPSIRPTPRTILPAATTSRKGAGGISKRGTGELETVLAGSGARPGSLRITPPTEIGELPVRTYIHSSRNKKTVFERKVAVAF